MSLPRNARGGSKVAGLGGYGKSPPRRKKKLDGWVYKDAQPWHPDTPRVRVPASQYVSRAFLTALHALSGHSDKRPREIPPYCLICNPEWR